ncbi:kinesin motor domain protein, partial [Ichthyophthirius multifiliis]
PTPFISMLRVRPLFIPEQTKNPYIAVEVIDKQTVIFRHEINQGLKSITKDKLYMCTKVIPPVGKTNQILSKGILDLVNDSFKGFSQSVFIIGGKFSGKTHTFLGNINDPGLAFQISRALYQQKQKIFINSKIFVSFFGFENGFRDLLAFTGHYLEHVSTQNGCYLPGLAQIQCNEYHDFLCGLKCALKNDGKRDINRSPFTSFFKEFLGGKGKSYVIGNCSPFIYDLEYSMRTVRQIQWSFKSTCNPQQNFWQGNVQESFKSNFYKTIQFFKPQQ